MDLLEVAAKQAAELVFMKLQYREVALCLARETSYPFEGIFQLALKVSRDEFYLLTDGVLGTFFPPQTEYQLPKLRAGELHNVKEIIAEALLKETEHHLKSFRFTLLFEKTEKVIALWSARLILVNHKKPPQNFTVQQLVVNPYVVCNRFRSSFDQEPCARAFLSEQDITNINLEARHILRTGVNPIGFLGSSAIG